MSPLRYPIRFLSPAFLGDARKSARWRTPPFKALLRQCWRMAWAQDHGFDVDIGSMRREEGRLFGSAADEARSSRSLLRLRLDAWTPSKLREWQALGQINIDARLRVGADLYLGYWPVLNAKPQSRLKNTPAIGAGERHELAIGFDPRDLATVEREHPRLLRAIQLAATYGSVGGRSRNGWGSFAMEGVEAPTAVPQRDWREALRLDWPHAIGRDEKGVLEWQSAAQPDWRAAMTLLARVRLGVRRQFPLQGSGASPGDRLWLAYPVTKAKQASWDPLKGVRSGRIPNSLRFRLRESAQGLRAVVFHVPCRPPAAYRPDQAALERVWREAHRWLDDHEPLTRVQR